MVHPFVFLFLIKQYVQGANEIPKHGGSRREEIEQPQAAIEKEVKVEHRQPHLSINKPDPRKPIEHKQESAKEDAHHENIAKDDKVNNEQQKLPVNNLEHGKVNKDKVDEAVQEKPVVNKVVNRATVKPVADVDEIKQAEEKVINHLFINLSSDYH